MAFSMRCLTRSFSISHSGQCHALSSQAQAPCAAFTHFAHCRHTPLRPPYTARRAFSSTTPRCAALSRSISPIGNNGWLTECIESDPVRSDYDAILVLGGGLHSDGGVPPWVTRRLDAAHYLFNKQNIPSRKSIAEQEPEENGNGSGTNGGGGEMKARKATHYCPILLLGAGTPHKHPVLDHAGFVLHESTAYASYLLKLGVPSAALLKETSSYDTVGNGYFSATMHAVPAGWRRLAVITSKFHMHRTRAIFDSTYSLAASDILYSPGAFELSYHPVSDEGLFDPGVVEARVEKERAAAATWHRNVQGMSTMAELHAWMFATHLCYSVSRQHEFGVKDDIDPRLAATY